VSFRIVISIGNMLLERLRLRLVPGRLRIQPRNQFMRAGWNADFSLADNLPGAQFSTVEILVGAAVGTQSRAFQRDSREQSLIARVRENLRVHNDVGSTLGRASLWAGGGGGIGGAFISRPLAIVVIGGLFSSTLLTLILVPVLYSEASRFTSARTNRELDTMLDDAQSRRLAAGGGH